jgi:4-hydroxybenzoate polyprenyltransferase/phosphoserine phosphatase
MPNHPEKSLDPLCVDLDGTLIRSDLLLESLLLLLKRNALYLLRVPFWLLAGRARLKDEIARRVELDASSLPFNEEFLEYLRRERSRGRTLVLATASNVRLAERVAEHLGIFDQVLASDGTVNRKGANKLSSIQALLKDAPFAYAGNSKADLPIWRHAREAVLVNPEADVAEKTMELTRVAHSFSDERPGPLDYLRMIRIHQWLKNLLLFVPLGLSHKVTDPVLLGQALLAFLAFSLCASSVYVLNDLLDLPSDRRHPSKCRRPLASGRIPVVTGLKLVPIFVVGAVLAASFVTVEFFVVLGCYFGLTLAYSVRLKRAALVDVIVLAGLYTLRIVAGAAAVSVPLSFWLLAFSMFLFLSLALVKRYTELQTLQKSELSPDSNRGYRTDDLEMLAQFGGASGYSAVLVLALYINRWMLARRGELHEDPVVFAMRDRRSQWLSALGLFFMWLSV